MMLRARDFATARGQRLHWCVARDIPLHRDDRDLPAAELDAKRSKWLLRPDQNTAHVASSVPLVKGLPVRLTDCINRRRFLFRGRRGYIHGWAPHPLEERQVVDDVVFLSRLPQTIYVHFPGATWQIEDLPQGVYPITPVSRTWLVNKRTKVKVRRTGFFLVPDFASTAHMIQGQSLEAAFADVVVKDIFDVATEEAFVMAYVMLSRAKFLHQLWIMQPFGQQLFLRGPPLGPELLLKKLRGELSPKEAQEAFDSAERAASNQTVEKDPMKRKFRCTACFLMRRKSCEKPPQTFGAFSSTEIFEKITYQGAWARCLACTELADQRRRELERRRRELASRHCRQGPQYRAHNASATGLEISSCGKQSTTMLRAQGSGVQVWSATCVEAFVAARSANSGRRCRNIATVRSRAKNARSSCAPSAARCGLQPNTRRRTAAITPPTKRGR